jgi:hypothetical protein
MYARCRDLNKVSTILAQPPYCSSLQNSVLGFTLRLRFLSIHPSIVMEPGMGRSLDSSNHSPCKASSGRNTDSSNGYNTGSSKVLLNPRGGCID